MSGATEERLEDRRQLQKARAAAVWAAVLFGIATVAGIAFAIAYVVSGDTQPLGIALAVACVGIGIGLVAWAHELMPQGPHVEKRDLPWHDDEDEEAGAAEAFREGARGIGRRGFLGRMLALAAGAFGLAALFPLRSLGPDPFPERTTTGWTEGARLVRETGHPVRVDELEVGTVVTVFPEGFIREADSQTVLIRVRPEDLQLDQQRMTWAPEGHVAYSKVCTHAGCPVGLYQTENHRLLCPCHQSAFIVTEGARPAFGPATRSLPQLPLAVDGEGYLIASGDFPEPIGPGFWSWPKRGGET
ncbi:MAG: Rieske (2Fe-2S) protein [Actinobacteria bacterium]|nr:Rieske (2Fe-2S) protein [Actinomycetota bacterium]